MSPLYWMRDPGHAWLAVPLNECPDLLSMDELRPGIEEYEGQPIHYFGPVVIDGVAYLEQDDEARAFFARYGQPPFIPVVDIPSFDAFCAQNGEVNSRRVEA